MTGSMFPRSLLGVAAARRGLVALTLALMPLGAAVSVVPSPALAVAADLPDARVQGWSVHRYMGGAIAQIASPDRGWLAVRCQRRARVGELSFRQPSMAEAAGHPLDVEFSFDGGGRVAQRLTWDEVERHWRVRFGPRGELADRMARSGTMRVTVRDGLGREAPGSDFTLDGSSGALSRMFEICA
ncbi:MAG: hypothetical protein VYD87_09845 [Pseudomonadota bacterium]|nr:hypothetical protein [Pseudomonadota bacterium]MEE3099685.1 hypothetical protein [Pseudomonadota bacterium]